MPGLPQPSPVGRAVRKQQDCKVGWDQTLESGEFWAEGFQFYFISSGESLIFLEQESDWIQAVQCVWCGRWLGRAQSDLGEEI